MSLSPELTDFPGCPHCGKNDTGLYTRRAIGDHCYAEDAYRCEKCGVTFPESAGIPPS